MYVSARERKLLERLLVGGREITVGELAEELNVSTRTIHRDLQGLESVLRHYGLELVKKAGVGIRLVGKRNKSRRWLPSCFIFLTVNIRRKNGS